MSFNDNANLDTSQVESGGGGGRGGLAVGGGIGGIVVLILTLLFGGNITNGGASSSPNPGQNEQFDPGQVQPGGAQANDFSQCRTGADANRDVQCRVIGTVNSVQDYWTDELPRYGKIYRKVNTVLYSGATASACGTASNQVGPFYCPVDKKVYIDASFFAELTSRSETLDPGRYRVCALGGIRRRGRPDPEEAPGPGDARVLDPWVQR